MMAGVKNPTVKYKDGPDVSFLPSLVTENIPRTSETHIHARLDRVGIWFSMICAVHCMIMPIVLVLNPVLYLIRWSRTADVIVLGLAAGIGLTSCCLGFRHHRNPSPLLLVLAGVLMNGTGRLAGEAIGPLIAQTLIIAGPLLMAYGLWKDRRICKCKRGAK